MSNFNSAEKSYLEDDRDENSPVGYCEHCGAEIYEGDDIIEIDGEMICDDIDCLLGHTGAVRTSAESE